MAYAKLAELDSSKDHWTIRVRVCRAWEAQDFKNNNEVFALEMVFVDSQGDSIQAYVRKNHIMRFKPLIKEGGIYVVREFKVSKASVQYRVVPNNKRIYFNITTSLRAVTPTSDEIPQHALYFAPKDILEDRIGNNTILTDIIGCVVAFGPTKTVATGPMKEIDLENDTHGIMQVTLWGNITMLFDIGPYEVDKSPVILSITSTTIRKFKGMSSITQAIKVNIRTPRPQPLGFPQLRTSRRKCLGSKDDVAVRIPLTKQANLNRMTIAQLLAMEWVSDNQTHFCTFVGEIIEVAEQHGWCYVSCNNCHKKVTPRDGSFFHPICNKPCSYPIIRYKLHVHAKDSTGSTTLVIFNDDAEKLLKAPIDTFSGRLSIGEKDIPREIVNLVGKTFIFKIKVTDYNLKDGFENYTVAKIFEEVGPAQKRKVEDTPSITHAVDMAAIGNASSSGHNSLGPVTPKKKTLDGEKMKVSE